MERSSIDSNNSQHPEDNSSTKKWVPNRPQKKVRSKKSFDEKRFDYINADNKKPYKGELDDNSRNDKQFTPYSTRVVKGKQVLVKNKFQPASKKRKSVTSIDPQDFLNAYNPSKATPARLAALYVTQIVRIRKAYAQEIIEGSIDTSNLDARDRSFATLLALGVVSSSGSLDCIIDKCLSNPKDIKRDVRDALRIATYEIIYLKKECHAAVNQGVELARAVSPSASRLANAVLHRIARLVDEFPFGDPQNDIKALALLYAFPEWLARMLIEELGFEKARAFMEASNNPAPLYIHINSLKSNIKEVSDIFEKASSPLIQVINNGIKIPHCFEVRNHKALVDPNVKALFKEGKILVSDASAQAVAYNVALKACDSLLEIGAGRGTKTVLIQSFSHLIRGRMLRLTPLDNHAFKIRLLKKRAEDYGISVEEGIVGNALNLSEYVSDKSFDTIFIDAPCSGLGTMRRHHEIRWSISLEKIEEFSHLGLGMLMSAAQALEEGGTLIYSTCTVGHWENQDCVKQFLTSSQGRAFSICETFGKSCFYVNIVSGSPDAHFAASFIKATKEV